MSKKTSWEKLPVGAVVLELGSSVRHKTGSWRTIRPVGAEVNGPAYVQVLTPCPTGWRFDPELTVEIGRLAVQTGYYPLYEIENGKLNVTVKVSQRKPVIEFLKLQGRFRHLKGKEVDTIQSRVYGQCKQLGIS